MPQSSPLAFIIKLLLAFLAASPSNATTAGVFKSLSSDEPEAIWAGDIDNYKFTDHTIECVAGKGMTIYTKERYADFVAQFEFKLPREGNSGLAIRFPGRGNPAYDGMCELQILDNTAENYSQLDPRQYHGSAYGMVAAARGHLKPVGEWNKQTVTVIGSCIRVILNDVCILDTDLSKISELMNDQAHPGKELTEGHFGIAGHKSPVVFKNIQIKRIGNAN